MFWWLGSYAYKKTVALRLLLRLSAQAQSNAIGGGIPSRCPPIDYARTPNGWVFMTMGLVSMFKWNGISYGVKGVGVIPPQNKPGLAIKQPFTQILEDGSTVDPATITDTM